MDDGTEGAEEGKPRRYRSIAFLRLNIKEATAGRTWLLLPEGFRDMDSGMAYPLPTRTLDLQRLASIPIPPRKKDAGVLYLRRVIKEWRRRMANKQSAILDLTHREEQIKVAGQRCRDDLKALQAQAKNAVDDVRREAEKAIASLSDLFSLGREGIDGQMQAHIKGEEWKGEKITAHAFRDCFRLVSQAVKGLGLPSEQREKARDAILEEAAAALRDTQETIAMAPGGDDPETEH